MSVLKYLEDEQVVYFELSEDKKTVQVEECCDGYYWVRLDRYHMARLIAELQGIYDAMLHGGTMKSVRN